MANIRSVGSHLGMPGWWGGIAGTLGQRQM